MPTETRLGNRRAGRSLNEPIPVLPRETSAIAQPGAVFRAAKNTTMWQPCAAKASGRARPHNCEALMIFGDNAPI